MRVVDVTDITQKKKTRGGAVLIVRLQSKEENYQIVWGKAEGQ